MKAKTRIYLDTSVYNRPFDDQNQAKIRLETEVFLSILEKVISGSLIVVSSSVLLYENSYNPFYDRRERVASYLSVASKTIRLTEAIKERAKEMENAGIDSIDALHLACAESNADFFITCDAGIIRKVKRKSGMFKIEVCSPLEFALKEVFRSA